MPEKYEVGQVTGTLVLYPHIVILTRLIHIR